MGDPASELPEQLAVLRDAVKVSIGPHGFSSTRSPEYQAFEWARARGPALLPWLDWLLVHATPGGRLYAAMLMEDCDPAAGERAFRAMLGSTDEIRITPGGCSPFLPLPLGDFAAERMAAGSYRRAVESRALIQHCLRYFHAKRGEEPPT